MNRSLLDKSVLYIFKSSLKSLVFQIKTSLYRFYRIYIPLDRITLIRTQKKCEKPLKIRFYVFWDPI